MNRAQNRHEKETGSLSQREKKESERKRENASYFVSGIQELKKRMAEL